MQRILTDEPPKVPLLPEEIQEVQKGLDDAKAGRLTDLDEEDLCKE